MRRLMMRRRGSQMATPRTGDVAHSRRRLRLPTSGAALAVSIAALIVAMAGSAYAGSTLANGSVGTKQLQKPGGEAEHHHDQQPESTETSPTREQTRPQRTADVRARHDPSGSVR